MTDVYELRRLARELAAAYNALDTLKWTPTRPNNIRVMKPTFRSATPEPDADHALNLNIELGRDTPDEHIPGGLRPMAKDALTYTPAPRHTNTQHRHPDGTPKQPPGYLDDHCTNNILCAYIARHAGDIADKFPAADELADLLAAQLHYLNRQLDKRYGPPPAERPETRHTSTITVRILAQQGITITPQHLHTWAARGHITRKTNNQGRGTYLLSEVLAWASRNHQQPPTPQPH